MKFDKEIKQFFKQLKRECYNTVTVPLAEGIKKSIEDNNIKEEIDVMNKCKNRKYRLDFICANAEMVGWLPQQIDSDEALGVLVYFLLGKNWYIPAPLGRTQANADIVRELLEKYSKEYREAQKRGLE